MAGDKLAGVSRKFYQVLSAFHSHAQMGKKKRPRYKQLCNEPPWTMKIKHTLSNTVCVFKCCGYQKTNLRKRKTCSKRWAFTASVLFLFCFEIHHNFCVGLEDPPYEGPLKKYLWLTRPLWVCGCWEGVLGESFRL